jgi:hypothetical protein
MQVGEAFLQTRDMPLELTDEMKLKSKEEIKEWSDMQKGKLRVRLVEFMQMCMRLMQIYGDVLKAMKQEAASDKKAAGSLSIYFFFASSISMATLVLPLPSSLHLPFPCLVLCLSVFCLPVYLPVWLPNCCCYFELLSHTPLC